MNSHERPSLANDSAARAEAGGVSVVILAHGKERLLAECLDAVDRAVVSREGTEVLVVVNDLPPSARYRLRSRQGIDLLEPKSNLGFAGGVEAALGQARGEWILLLNDDAVIEPGALDELLAAGRSDPDIGAVAAQVRFADRPDVINSAGLEIDELGIARERHLGEPVEASDTDVSEVFGASAAAAVYRRAMLDDVGGFDVSFFAYLEDADVAWRARMRGWRTLYAPRAVVHHHHSASLGHGSRDKYYLVGRNRVRMLAKNAVRPQLIRRLPAIVAYDALYVAFTAVTARTLAPLRGRMHGLNEWRIYRAAGAPVRRPVELEPPFGLRAALTRDRAYRR